MGMIAGLRGRRWLLTGLLVAVALLSVPATVADAALLTVTTNDGGAPAVDGQCSLREAIQNAVNNALTNADCLVAGEASPTLDTIQFNIGGGGVQTIAPNSTFNNLSGGPLTIDAATQPGPGALPLITLDGVGAGAGVSGFTITGADVTIRGFAIVRYDGSGVLVQAGAQRAIIEGNHIGVDRTGLIARANGVGISTTSAFTLRVGGTSASQRNVISGNTGNGLSLSGLSTGLIQGNVIGTDLNGTTAIPNGSNGIGASGFVTGLTVGGTAAGAGNVISGNAQHGIFLDGPNVSAPIIEGNRIGTNLAGTAAIPNGASGIFIGDADNARIGGSDPGAGNQISGNTLHGVYLTDNANGTQVQGNLIGLNAAGTAALANGQNGVRFENARGDVGAAAVPSRNVISGNGSDGIFVDSQSSNIGVRSNFVGTNALGTAAIANGASGLRIQGTNHAVIGNLFSGNAQAGITLTSVQLVDVRSNQIGTDVTALLPIPNGGAGVSISAANRIEIGDIETSGRGNTVAFNVGPGVTVAADTDRVGVVDNSIFGNGGLGIDLLPLGVNANDAGDGDGGANTGQNFPVILTAVSDATLTVTGTLNTTASTNGVRIQVFSSTACDPAGNGEGQRFLGEVTVATDAGGNVAWQAAGLPAVGAGAVITTTASTVSGTGLNTSEFSACFVATAPVVTPSPSPSPSPSPGISPTPTATPGPVNPTDPANNDGDAQGKPKNEKVEDARETETERQQRERTNRRGSDDYRTEGNVVAVDLDARPRTATIATRDGLQVIVLLCRDSCDDPQVGDYLEAEGEKEHEALFYADSVTSRRGGR